MWHHYRLPHNHHVINCIKGVAPLSSLLYQRCATITITFIITIIVILITLSGAVLPQGVAPLSSVLCQRFGTTIIIIVIKGVAPRRAGGSLMEATSYTGD